MRLRASVTILCLETKKPHRSFRKVFMGQSRILNCSAVLCVRNEESRIFQGLEKIQKLPVDEIIVVDGGSTDKTWEILRGYASLNALQAGRVGLLAQRIAGIDAARNEVLLILDIDDSISEEDFRVAYNELISNSVIDGIQFSLHSDGQSWFSRAWSTYLSIANPPQSKIPLLGRPCLTYKKHYLNLTPPKEQILSDDLWLSFNLSEGPKTFVTTEQKTIRSFPTTFRDNFLKFVDYGVSDYHIATAEGRRGRLMFHSFWRIAILRSFSAIRPGKWRYFPFPLMHGIVRGTTHLLLFIKAFNQSSWPGIFNTRRP